MKTNKKRKEVVLEEETIEILQYKAEKASSNLKNYTEFVLNRKAYAFELPEEYKVMMDNKDRETYYGKTYYTSWD